MRLALFILAYNLGDFLRRLCLPRAVMDFRFISTGITCIPLEKITTQGRSL